MAITPIYNNAMMQRTPELSQMKHNQDVRPVVEQQNIQKTNEQQVERNARQIIEKDNIADNGQERHDAKEKGRGIFFDIRKKDKLRQVDAQDDEDGIVIDKKNSHFDMKI
ncbi:MAG: hypothetical protein E7261_08905 [Lachnospiraceae bacterium]|nr:hypothetical protein [Lachnospiraceae bacterium]